LQNHRRGEGWLATGPLDGNKRLAWTATVAFLNLNDLDLPADAGNADEYVISVAEGRFDA
jgi:prophage maintenance system killer protein